MERIDPVENFDNDYIYFDEVRNSKHNTQRQADMIWRLADLGPGHRVLDSPCGYGRISNELALRGASVTGIDSNSLMLDEAIHRSRDLDSAPARFIHGDMREPLMADNWHLILCWFNSFGYFSDQECLGILKNWREGLAADGVLILNFTNPFALARQLGDLNRISTVTTKRGEDTRIDLAKLDSDGSSVNVERIIIRGGRTRTVRYSMRLFSAQELRWMLDSAGFRSVEFFQESGSTYTWRSWEIVAVVRV